MVFLYDMTLLRYLIHYLLIRRDIHHRISVMHIPKHAGLINKHLRGKSTQLERLDLLSIQPLNDVFRIRYPDKRQIFLQPVFLKKFGFLRSDNDYFCIRFYEVLIIPAQLRQILAAEWSGKSAIENQQHIPSAGKIRKGHFVSIKIERSKFGRMCVSLDSFHDYSPALSLFERLP